MRKNKFRFILLFALSALLLGCAAKPPTEAEIASANYGAEMSQDQAENLVKGFFQIYLKDPDSAKYVFSDVKRNYYQQSAISGGEVTYGYTMLFSVNAKNSYGGYPGAKTYIAFMRDGKLIAIYQESRIGGKPSYNVRVL
ncbi:TPA: hypothetical protein ACMDP7_001700 [Vibrio cholerae]